MAVDESANKEFSDDLFDAYVVILKEHDWYYERSDDHKVWQKGNRIRRYLVKVAKDRGGRFQEAYDKKGKVNL